jgi:ATP-binding cassette subfamily B protein
LELTRNVIPLRTRLQTALRLERALRLVWQTAPRWTLVNAALVFVQGGPPLAALYLMKRIVDAVTASIAAPGKAIAFERVVLRILLAGGVAILTALTRAVMVRELLISRAVYL